MTQDVTKYVGQQIRKYRKLKKLTQKELGDKIGVKHNTVSSYENGTNEPDQEMIFAIAHALDVNINNLFPSPNYIDVEKSIQTNEMIKQYITIHQNSKDLNKEERTDSVKGSDIVSKFVKVPVYGQISCGNGRIIFEDPIDYEHVPREWLNGGQYITLLALGNSMTGSRIFEGDRLLIRLQDEVENGEIAAVVVGDETLLKKVYKRDNTLILESSNENYETKFIDLNDNKNVKILGKLKKSITNF